MNLVIKYFIINHLISALKLPTDKQLLDEELRLINISREIGNISSSDVHYTLSLTHLSKDPLKV